MKIDLLLAVSQTGCVISSCWSANEVSSSTSGEICKKGTISSFDYTNFLNIIINYFKTKKNVMPGT